MTFDEIMVAIKSYPTTSWTPCEKSLRDNGFWSLHASCKNPKGHGVLIHVMGTWPTARSAYVKVDGHIIFKEDDPKTNTDAPERLATFLRELHEYQLREKRRREENRKLEMERRGREAPNHL